MGLIGRSKTDSRNRLLGFSPRLVPEESEAICHVEVPIDVIGIPLCSHVHQNTDVGLLVTDRS